MSSFFQSFEAKGLPRDTLFVERFGQSLPRDTLFVERFGQSLPRDTLFVERFGHSLIIFAGFCSCKTSIPYILYINENERENEPKWFSPKTAMDVVGGIPSGSAPARCGVPIRRFGQLPSRLSILGQAPSGRTTTNPPVVSAL